MDKIRHKYTEKDFLSLLLARETHIFEKSLTDTKILPFIMGVRKGFTVLDLSKTLSLLKKVLFMVEEYISNKGQIIIVCDSQTVNYKQELKALKKYFIVVENSWPEGSLTNFSDLRDKSSFFQRLSPDLANTFGFTGLMKKMNRKKKTQIEMFFNKFQLLGFVSENPRLVICLSSSKNIFLFNELKSLNIPVVALTNNLKLTVNIDYPILCNVKDSLFIKFFLFLLINTAKKGQKSFFIKHKLKTLSNLKKKKMVKLINKNYGK